MSNNIPENSKYLSGEGAGAWFHFEKLSETNYRIRRFTPNGELDCDRVFKISDSNFDINTPFEITYISHCRECNVIQKEKRFSFTFLKPI